MTPTVRLIQGDALTVLRTLPAESVQCVVTSPPYWALRDYGTDGQLGLEKHLDCLGWATGQPCGECWVCHLVEVLREVRRVLRKDGTVWLNLGTSYASGGGGERGGSTALHGAGQITEPRNRNGTPRSGNLKPKDLCMQPARLALALQADGWWVRSEIIWAKGLSFCPTYAGSVMPESVTDRPTNAHEKVFLLTKAAKYFYDAEAVREPLRCPDAYNGTRVYGGPNKHDHGTPDHTKGKTAWDGPAARNLRNVWAITTQPWPLAHFATYPEALVEPCIKAGTSERGCCGACGKPWVREVEKSAEYKARTGKGWHDHTNDAERGQRKSVPALTEPAQRTVGWHPSCACGAGDPVPCLVLDPFAGSGTTLLVAAKLGRSAVGIELNPEYCAMAEKRINDGALGLFGRVEVEAG